jgi:hypothetical protein
MPHYTEKTGELPHRQMLAPNLLGRHSADQQVSTKHHTVFPQPPLGYTSIFPWADLTPSSCKKNPENKELKLTHNRGGSMM